MGDSRKVKLKKKGKWKKVIAKQIKILNNYFLETMDCEIGERE